MRRLFSTRFRKFLGLSSIVALVLGGLVWWQWHAVVAGYCVQGLVRADEGNRAAWVERTAGLDFAAVPGLCAALEKQDGTACANVRLTLARLIDCWPAADPRQAALRSRLLECFPRLSTAGQGNALELYAEWLNKAPSPSAAEGAIGLLAQSGRGPDRDVRCRALILANTLLQHGPTPEQISACRELARVGLQDPEAANRVEAVRLAVQPQIGLARQAAPLLDDPSPKVRQMAILAVGGTTEAVATDDLLRSLHDTDADVRRLCEAALKSRGLRPEEVTMARLVTDTRAAVRLQVLNRIGRADLEPGSWLRRLSQDPSPAVRAGAIRAAAEFPDVDFGDLLQRMADRDTSSTVRQLAQYYMKRRGQREISLENR